MISSFHSAETMSNKTIDFFRILGKMSKEVADTPSKNHVKHWLKHFNHIVAYKCTISIQIQNSIYIFKVI